MAAIRGDGPHAHVTITGHGISREVLWARGRVPGWEDIAMQAGSLEEDGLLRCGEDAGRLGNGRPGGGSGSFGICLETLSETDELGALAVEARAFCRSLGFHGRLHVQFGSGDRILQRFFSLGLLQTALIFLAMQLDVIGPTGSESWSRLTRAWASIDGRSGNFSPSNGELSSSLHCKRALRMQPSKETRKKREKERRKEIRRRQWCNLDR